MNSYNNQKGVILGLIFALIYSIIRNGFDFASIIGGAFGILVISAIITSLISAFWKFKNFGKIFGIISLILSIISFLGSTFE